MDTDIESDVPLLVLVLVWVALPMLMLCAIGNWVTKGRARAHVTFNTSDLM